MRAKLKDGELVAVNLGKVEHAALHVPGRLNTPKFMGAAQVKNPENQVEAVGRQAARPSAASCCRRVVVFGEYDLVIIADVPTSKAWRGEPSQWQQAAPSRQARRRR